MPSNAYYMHINSPEWRNKSLNCRALSRHHCALIPFFKAEHAHHLTYRNMGSELPVRDIVALSAIAHKIVHFPLFFKVKPIRTFSNWFLRIAYVFSIFFWNLLALLGRK